MFELIKKAISIDPNILFSRLLILSQRDGDIKPIFQYELAPVPTALFEDSFMRKSNKAQLIHALFGKNYQLVDQESIIATDENIVDGGSLLRQISWPEKATFSDVLNK